MVGEGEVNLFTLLSNNQGTLHGHVTQILISPSRIHGHKSALSSKLSSYIKLRFDDFSVDLSEIQLQTSTIPVATDALELTGNSSTSGSDNVINDMTDSLRQLSASTVAAALTNGDAAGSSGSGAAPFYHANASPSHSSAPAASSSSSATASSSSRTLTPSVSGLPVASGSAAASPTAPGAEEPLPTGWEVRYDTYGR